MTAPDPNGQPAGHWHVHGERNVYSSDRIDVVLADVQEPGGSRVPEHHLVRCHIRAAAGPSKPGVAWNSSLDGIGRSSSTG